MKRTRLGISKSAIAPAQCPMTDSSSNSSPVFTTMIATASIQRGSGRPPPPRPGDRGDLVDHLLDFAACDILTADFDHVLQAIDDGDVASGSSEIPYWIMTAGMSEHLTNDWSEYYPPTARQAEPGQALRLRRGPERPPRSA